MEHYRLSKKADSDIANHYEHGILNFGFEQAHSYLLGLYEYLQSLADNPMFGRNAEELAPELRRFEYGSHVIFYMPEDTGILIVRVLRKEMDFKRHL